ncbi:MAG: hypothetical protein K9J12_15950 [Melioribacteraceae bacterium]|nr:hypothetical protein [Melioribacteraceae bacterium]MCF8263663.1 hypothetical protein [Melioribacteraceae bacterium]MCF8412600.1 hypothetical protein [Melioribacteraceae bacterium]MCF8431399.1 hypothetical protein [Melioribacteraceae bacterium]
MAVSEEKRKELMKHICSNLGEDFGELKCEELMKEIEDCDCANNYLRTLEKTIEVYKRYNAEVSPEVHNRLMDILDLTDDE